MASRNRGVKRPKLRDLSQDPLNPEEQMALLKALDMSLPPIALAILGAIMVEHELELSLRAKLPRKDDQTWASLLEERGPLSTFSRKILAGHAHKIYDEATKANLDIIRNVRNAFAHSKRIIDFDHPLVVAELDKIQTPRFKKREFAKLNLHVPKSAFMILCLLVTVEIVKRRNKSETTAQRRREKRALARSPLYQLLAPAMGIKAEPSQKLSPLGSLVFSRGHQSADPTSQAPQGLLGGLFRLGESFVNKNDK